MNSFARQQLFIYGAGLVAGLILYVLRPHEPKTIIVYGVLLLMLAAVSLYVKHRPNSN